MSTIMEKAKKGNRKALEELYDGVKTKVYYVSLKLLETKEEAEKATCFAIKSGFENLDKVTFDSQKDFEDFCIKKAVDYCKIKVTKQNSKAFKLPQNQNFLVTADKKTAKEKDKNVLKMLPELQRFILVLDVVCNYSAEQIAGVFKFDVKTVQMALGAQTVNVERLLQIMGDDTDFSQFSDGLINQENQTKISQLIDREIAHFIDGIALPIERKRKNKITLWSTVLSVAVVCILCAVLIINPFANDSDTDTTADDGTSESEPQESTAYTPELLDESLTYYADIDIENYGVVTVKLDEESAPISAANFVSLADSGFYNGLTFHRIIEDFMMQGGDPNGDGTGGSENTIVGEFSENGYENSLSHTRGAISMARSSDYDSASSQFFIVHKDSTYLDGQYAVFGYVSEGMDIVDAICEAAEPADDNGTIESQDQPVITAVTIRTE